MDSTGVKSYWDKRAERTNLKKGEVTHSDTNQRALEIEIALSNIPSKQKILDIGYGNGYSPQYFTRCETRC